MDHSEAIQKVIGTKRNDCENASGPKIKMLPAISPTESATELARIPEFLYFLYLNSHKKWASS